MAGQRNLNGKNGRGKVKKPSEKTNRPSEPGSSRNRLSGGPATPRAARKNPRPTKRTGRGAVINAIATSLIPGNQVDDSPVIIQEMSEPRNDEPARRNPEPLNLTVQMAEVSFTMKPFLAKKYIRRMVRRHKMKMISYKSLHHCQVMRKNNG